MRPLTALLIAGTLFASGGCSLAVLPDETAWQAWVDTTEAAYAEDPQAVLKVNDAIYVRPGETVWLAGRPEDPASYHWSVTQPEDPAALSVAFALPEPDLPQATLTHAGQRLAFGTDRKTHALSEDILVYGGPSGLGTDDPRFAAFIYNQRHPAAAAFGGLSFYPYDPAFRVEADIVPTDPPEARTMQTERGLVKRFFEVGRAHFTLDGTAVDMPLYSASARTDGIGYVFAPFMDETTGTETYGVGRYMDIELAGGVLPESLTIDFNYAYNPLCARSEHFNCPVVEFSIPAPVRAGERHDYSTP